MFTIKRKNTRKQQISKKLPYYRFVEDDTCSSKNEQPMPNIIEPRPFKQFEKSSRDKFELNIKLIDSVLIPKPPMLAKPEDPNNIQQIENYVYEEKYDGERMLTIVFDNDNKKCFTRNLKISNIFKNKISLNFGFHHCILDGELVYLDDNGQIVSICDTGSRAALQTQYIVFDVQMINGEDVTNKSLLERKKLLSDSLIETHFVKISKYVQCSTLDTTLSAFDNVCFRNGEGLMLKYIHDCYTPDCRRWIKLKRLHLKQNRDEYDLYAYKFKKDKNGVCNILDCGYFDSQNNYVHVSNVSSGIDNQKRNRLRLLSDPNTGLFYNRTIVTIIADKVTNSKSLRHPSLNKIRNDIDLIDISKFQ